MTLLSASGRRIDHRATLPPDKRIRMPDGRDLVPFQRSLVGAAWRTSNGLLVIASIDPTSHGPLLHVSMSYSNRDPSWQEIKDVRALFYSSDIDAMMMLPREADYVNLHEHTFHLWQTPTEWGIQ